MLTHTGVYITDSKNKTVELPVAPKEIKFPYEIDASTATVLGLGEVNRLGLDKLTTVTIDETFPRDMKDAVWATCEERLEKADDYIKFLQDARELQKPVRLVVSNSMLNLSCQITKFEVGLENTIEYKYSLTLTEYRNAQAKKLAIPKKAKKKVTPKKGKQRPAPVKKIGIGSVVKVNGQLHRDSYGSGPGQTEHNSTLRISNVAPGRKYPYHVVTADGGWRGWVSAGAVKLK